MKEANTSKHTAPARGRRLRRALLLALLAAVLAAGGLAFLFHREITGGGAAGQTVTVTVEQGSGVAAIAADLQQAGVIRFPRLFRWYVGRQGAAGRLQYGVFEVEQGASYDALIEALSAYAAADTTRLTFPEGTTAIAMAQKMEQAGLCTAEAFLDEANNGGFSEFTFWQYVPEEAPGRFMKCEGYLFPDTYEFYMGEDPVSVLNKMILRFDEIFTEQMRADIQASGHTINDAVIIASMIEKETDGQDQAQIASVIYNRLDNPTSETAGYLNIDATILYATGGTEVDLNADTPYNTRTHTGLPPTAISCPGVDALRAAVYPDDTNYYFYALGDDGLHHFFRTYQGQQDFIATQERYQNG